MPVEVRIVSTHVGELDEGGETRSSRRSEAVEAASITRGILLELYETGEGVVVPVLVPGGLGNASPRASRCCDAGAIRDSRQSVNMNGRRIWKSDRLLSRDETPETDVLFK